MKRFFFKGRLSEVILKSRASTVNANHLSLYAGERGEETREGEGRKRSAHKNCPPMTVLKFARTAVKLQS